MILKSNVSMRTLAHRLKPFRPNAGSTGPVTKQGISRAAKALAVAMVAFSGGEWSADIDYANGFILIQRSAQGRRRG